MREIQFTVPGFPPIKNEAKSMLAAGHGDAPRVMMLLRTALEAFGDATQPLFPVEPLAPCTGRRHIVGVAPAMAGRSEPSTNALLAHLPHRSSSQSTNVRHQGVDWCAPPVEERPLLPLNAPGVGGSSRTMAT